MKNFIPVTGWALVILFLSVTPSEELPETHIKFADKFAHFMVYAILSVLFVKDYHRYNGKKAIHMKPAIFMFIISCSYGILIELLQECCIPSRLGEWQDGLANALGSIFGMFTGLLFLRQVRQS